MLPCSLKRQLYVLCAIFNRCGWAAAQVHLHSPERAEIRYASSLKFRQHSNLFIFNARLMPSVVRALYQTRAQWNHTSAWKKQTRPLINSWNQLPSDLLRIHTPILAVLGCASFLIPQAAMNQQDCHENGVCPWEEVSQATSRTHAI